MDTQSLSSVALAQWITDFRLENCDKADVAEVRLRVLDLLICAAAGWKCNLAYNKTVTSVFFAMGGVPQSTVLFTGEKTSAPIAAYLNATYAHGADLDDGHRTANGHPGVAVIPAVLALAEKEHSSEKAVCEAILVGYETYIRVSKAMQPSLLRRGFHGTGVVGAVAASAACAKLLALDARQTHNAISLGAVQASGLFESSETGQETKPINPANACRTGVESALMARENIQAPEAPFEGVKGLYKAFCDDPKPEAITRDLGYVLGIRDCYVKLSPACRHTHPAIDAGAELGRRNNIAPENIRSIRIHTYPNAIFITGKIAVPRDSAQGKFSMRYAMAMAMQRGRYSLTELEESDRVSETTRAIIEKMELISDQSYENPAKKIRGCLVEILFADGSQDSCYVSVPRGERENPLQPGDMENKIRGCCEGVWDEAFQDALYESIMKAPTLNIQAVMEQVGKAL